MKNEMDIARSIAIMCSQYYILYLECLGGDPGNRLVHDLLVAPPSSSPPATPLLGGGDRPSPWFPPLAELSPYHSQDNECCRLLMLGWYGTCRVYGYLSHLLTKPASIRRYIDSHECTYKRGSNFIVQSNHSNTLNTL